MMPISAETNAINGRMVFSTVSMVSRPDWNSTATADPIPIPTFASRPSLCSVIFLLVSYSRGAAFCGADVPFTSVMLSSFTPDT